MCFYFLYLFVKYLNDINLSIIQKIRVETPTCSTGGYKCFFNILTHSKVWSHLLILYNDDDNDSLIRTMIVFKQQCCLKNHKNINFQLKLFLNASKLLIGSVCTKSRTLQ